VRPDAPSASAGRLCGVQPTVAQVPSLLQPPVGGFAVSAPRASKCKGDADQPDEQQHAAEDVCPAGYGREHLPRRHRSRRSLRPATQAPRWKRPHRIRRESSTGCRGSAEPRSRPSLRAIRTLAPATKGSPLGRCGRGRVLVVQQNHRERPSPVSRHANDTAQDATASRLRVDGHVRCDRASVGRRRVHMRFARRGAVFGGRPLACSRSGVAISLGREQRRCTHEREKDRPGCPRCLERRPALRHGPADPALAHALGGHQGRGRGTDAG